jgi:DNA-binding protein H-NS
MDVMLTSDVKTISSWRKQVKDHDKFVAELQSLKLMQENFTTVFKHACEYQRNYATDADGWHKKPLTLLEYEKLYPKRSERAHFVRGDSAPVCGLCGKPHAQGACLLDVNFKRVVDESSVVLRGVSDLMTLGQKLLTEVSKNKDAGANTSKLTAFVEKSDELVTRFKAAMAFQRKRFSKVQNLPKQTKALVAQEDEDATAQVAGTTTIRETVQKAMEAYALKPQELAKQIAGAMMRADKPSRTCYRWLNKGQCDNKDKGECKFDHPDELKGKGMQANNTAAAASGQTSKGSAAADGQVPGTLCAQCKTYPCCREDGRQHKYCSKTCAKAAGAYPGKAAAAKQATHVGMHGAAQAEDVPDPATALMIAAGVMPMESFDLIPLSFNAMCFTILSDNGAIVQSNADHNLVSLSQPVAGQNTNPSSSLQATQINHIGPGLLSALGGDIPTIDRKPLLVNDSYSILPSRLNLTGFNSFEILGTEVD